MSRYVQPSQLAYTRRASLLGLLIPLLGLPPTTQALDSGKVVKDPRFTLTLPPGFVASRRSAKQGTIYVAGDFPRFAILSVTAWPVSKLLDDDAAAQSLPGLPSSGQPPAQIKLISSIAQLGPPQQVAKLLLRTRDREASSGALQSDLLSFSADAAADSQDSISFTFETLLPVADPNELEKQRGVRSLTRRTTATSFVVQLLDASGIGGEPAVISVWGSALLQDWQADLGEPLSHAVRSFRWLQAPPISTMTATG